MTIVQKKSVTLRGHRTSISLEPEFWAALKQIADSQALSVSELIAKIDEKRIGGRQPDQGEPPNLSSAIRVFVLNHYLNMDENNGRE